jgi:hypothetical protein
MAVWCFVFVNGQARVGAFGAFPRARIVGVRGETVVNDGACEDIVNARCKQNVNSARVMSTRDVLFL